MCVYIYLYVACQLSFSLLGTLRQYTLILLSSVLSCPLNHDPAYADIVFCLIPWKNWFGELNHSKIYFFSIPGVGFLNWVTVRSSDEQWQGEVLKGMDKMTVTQCRLPRLLQEDSISIQSYLDFGDFGRPKYSVDSGCRTAVLRASKVKLRMFLKFVIWIYYCFKLPVPSYLYA